MTDFTKLNIVLIADYTIFDDNMFFFWNNAHSVHHFLEPVRQMVGSTFRV